MFPVILVLLIPLVGGGGGLYLAYRALVRDLGQTEAEETIERALVRRLPFALLLGLVLATLLLLPATREWATTALAALFVVITVLVWGLVIYSPIHRRNAGTVLLDLGPSKSSTSTLGAGLLVVAVVLYAATWEPGDAYEVAYAAMLASMAVLLYVADWRTSVRLTDRGISSFAFLMEWEKIKSYEWVDKERGILSLQVERRSPLVGVSRLRPVKWRVPTACRDQVTELLTQYVLNGDSESA